jgi:hypothetical protein
MDPLSTDILISQSTINNLLKCPAAVGYAKSDVEGVLPVFGEKVHFGTVFHGVCEQVIAGENLIKVTNQQNVLELARQLILEDGVDWIEYTTEQDRIEFAEEILHAVHVWHKLFWEPYSPSIVDPVSEGRLYTQIGEIGDRRVILAGTPDLLCSYLNEPVLFDWKTSGRPWKPGKSELELQGSLYMFLAEQNTGIQYRKACFVVYDRSKGQLEELWTERSDKHVETAVKTALAWANMIAKEVFPPTPVVWEFMKPKRGWHCSPKYCQAWNVCEYKFLPDDKSEYEKAVISWK